MELELPRENSFAGACLALHFGTFSRREAVRLMLQFVIGSRGICVLLATAWKVASGPIHLPAPRPGSLSRPFAEFAIPPGCSSESTVVCAVSTLRYGSMPVSYRPMK